MYDALSKSFKVLEIVGFPSARLEQRVVQGLTGVTGDILDFLLLKLKDCTLLMLSYLYNSPSTSASKSQRAEARE
jgi:hypothetical protein